MAICRVNFFNFLIAEQIFQKSTKWSTIHWGGVFRPKKNSWCRRLAICRVNNFNFLLDAQFLLGILPIVHLRFFGRNRPPQCIVDHLVDFEKIFTAGKKLKKFTRFIANRRPLLFFTYIRLASALWIIWFIFKKFVTRAKNWKYWLDISPIFDLNFLA